jgi:hypothetical protein
MATQQDLHETQETLEATISQDVQRSSTALRYTTDELASNLSLPRDEVDAAMSALAKNHSKVSQDGDEWVVKVS